MRLHKYGSLCSIFALLGCSSSSETGAPPPPVDDHPACVISADCPSGTYCDLGECIQSCNVKDPCTGELTCSPRGRCNASGAQDSDPKPSAQHVGDVTADPMRIPLTEKDHSFQVHLTASSQQPVRYRVQVRGPHLSIDQRRGEFTGTTTLTFKVDATKLSGRDVTGSIKIFTTLGDVVVDAPIHVGLTGAYRGNLRYDGGPVMLGDTRFGVDLIEKNGDVIARVDSKASLLFPTTDAGDTTGHGSFAVTDGLDLTLSQRFDDNFGGARNHFRRAIGRRVRLMLKPASSGMLEGTFEETIYGLFSEPIKTTGTASLSYVPRGTDPSFTVTADALMPDSPAKTLAWTPNTVFPWDEASCNKVLGCTYAPCDSTEILLAHNRFGTPLAASGATANPDPNHLVDNPFDGLASSCAATLATRNTTDYSKAGNPAQHCGLVPPLACAVQAGALMAVADKTTGKLVGTLAADAVAPSIVVAKNEIVGALYDSFANGISVEQKRYTNALAALAPTATWMTQPSILEYLRNMDSDVAKGDAATQKDTYPAAHALADLFSTIGVIDGELARIASVSSLGTQVDAMSVAQQHGVLAYLEAITLSEILRSWRTTPPEVGAKFLGVLTPMTKGYDALIQGANAFGVPAGFVPFVYRPEDIARGPTNFEQMLAIAHGNVLAEKADEDAFKADKRQEDLNKDSLAKQVQSVRERYDTRLKEICGPSFDPTAPLQDAEWLRCGSNGDGAPGSGEVGVLLLDIEQSKARLSSAEARITGMGTKIQIDTQALAQTQSVHDDMIRFISDQGDELITLTWVEGAINAAMDVARSVAANPNPISLGAGGAIAGLEAAKTGVEAERTHLQTVQKLRSEDSVKKIEWANGMANIKKEMVDLQQLQIDLRQEQLGIAISALKAVNAVTTARLMYEDRQRALGIIAKDPANDPTIRVLRDQQAVTVLASRARAQSSMYLAASALEYELNMSIPGIDGAVMNAHNNASLEALTNCLSTVFNSSRFAEGSPQDYVSTVSVRKMLGVVGPRTDAVTGQKLSEGDQFRELLLRNENLDGRGGVGVVFATNLDPDNQLWSADVCNDRIATVQAQLVGDFLGDNQAQVNLMLTGGSVMRACDSDTLKPWSVGGGNDSASRAFAVVQAGVNSFGDAPANGSLFGQSVARASWTLVIPGKSDAPSNSDVDITHVDDIVLKFTHKALPRRNAPVSIDVSCLNSVGR